MPALKSVFGVIGALVPILYCVGLIYYFLDVTGSVREAEANGLGPTLLGLAIVGLLFCIPLIVKIVRIFIVSRSPASGGRGSNDASTHEGEGAFDGDAVLARYMAGRSAEATPGSAATPPAHQAGEPATRPSFGRRIT